MLDRQHEPLSGAAQVQERIGPSVKIRAAAQRLPGLVAGPFTRVMDERDGAGEGPRKLTQRREDRRYLRRVVLVGGLQSYVRVQDQKARASAVERRT